MSHWTLLPSEVRSATIYTSFVSSCFRDSNQILFPYRVGLYWLLGQRQENRMFKIAAMLSTKHFEYSNDLYIITKIMFSAIT